MLSKVGTASWRYVTDFSSQAMMNIFEYKPMSLREVVTRPFASGFKLNSCNGVCFKKF